LATVTRVTALPPEVSAKEHELPLALNAKSSGLPLGWGLTARVNAFEDQAPESMVPLMVPFDSVGSSERMEKVPEAITLESKVDVAVSVEDEVEDSHSM
jgi:hypothetical protein